VQTVKEDQNDDGVWNSWPDTRPPIFGHSDETATALATLALLPPAAAGDESAVAARDKGLKWLAEHETTGDHQAVCVRLMLLRKTGRPEAETQPLVDRLIESQQADGGWRQSAEMASDAHATGQALYALAIAELKSSDTVLQRGRDFLIKTQREDGGWNMTSRPCPPTNMGAKNLIPITGAGSAWAVLGLVRSAE
jgi:prenyltransferase beta subunit